MTPYGKTPNVFMRNPETNKLVLGEYATPELDTLANARGWTVTEKLDGTNMRIAYEPLVGLLNVLGRTDKAQINGRLKVSLYDQVLGKIDQVFYGAESVCIYGEGIGPKIQGNPYGLEHPDFRAFAIRVGNVWLRWPDVVGIVGTLGLKTVPKDLVPATLLEAVELVQSGHQSHLGGGFAEGLVAVAPAGMLDRMGRRILCKIKHKELYNG